jgi:hypothetical protein
MPRIREFFAQSPDECLRSPTRKRDLHAEDDDIKGTRRYSLHIEYEPKTGRV